MQRLRTVIKITLRNEERGFIYDKKKKVSLHLEAFFIRKVFEKKIGQLEKGGGGGLNPERWGNAAEALLVSALLSFL